MKATLESRGVQTVENQHWESIIGLFGEKQLIDGWGRALT